MQEKPSTSLPSPDPASPYLIVWRYPPPVICWSTWSSGPTPRAAPKTQTWKWPTVSYTTMVLQDVLMCRNAHNFSGLTTQQSCGGSIKVPQPPPAPPPIFCGLRLFTSGFIAMHPGINLLGELTMRSPTYLHAPTISLMPTFCTTVINPPYPPATFMAHVDPLQ